MPINSWPLFCGKAILGCNFNFISFSFSSGTGEGKKRFHLHFELPLPQQIIIFSLGKWETHLKGQEIIAEVSIDAELPPQKLGTLASRKKSLCWDEVWSNKFLKKSEEVFEQVILIVG